MKYLLYSFISLLFCCNMLKAQGIIFADGSWEDICGQARAEHKLVFLDAYTTWCAPCKRMEREVFTDERIGAEFNKHFISIRIDMEKGEGIQLARTFGIGAYPTFIFADASGKVLHRDAGFKTPDQLLELAGIAFDDSRRLSAWQDRLESGERDSAFLREYTLLLKSLYDKSYTSVAEAYLATQPDWQTPAVLDFIFLTSEAADSRMFEYLLEHRTLFESRMGKDKVTAHIDGVAQHFLTDTNAGTSIEAAQELLRAVYPDKAERLSAAYPMTWYRRRGDRDNYAQAAISYFNQYHDNAGELSEAAWTFSEVITDPAGLAQAIKWAKMAAKMEPYSEHREVLARLYLKTGKTKKALQTIKTALALAQKNGEPTEALEALKANIEK